MPTSRQELEEILFRAAPTSELEDRERQSAIARNIAIGGSALIGTGALGIFASRVAKNSRKVREGAATTIDNLKQASGDVRKATAVGRDVGTLYGKAKYNAALATKPGVAKRLVTRSFQKGLAEGASLKEKRQIQNVLARKLGRGYGRLSHMVKGPFNKLGVLASKIPVMMSAREELNEILFQSPIGFTLPIAYHEASRDKHLRKMREHQQKAGMYGAGAGMTAAAAGAFAMSPTAQTYAGEMIGKGATAVQSKIPTDRLKKAAGYVAKNPVGVAKGAILAAPIALGGAALLHHSRAWANNKKSNQSADAANDIRRQRFAELMRLRAQQRQQTTKLSAREELHEIIEFDKKKGIDREIEKVARVGASSALGATGGAAIGGALFGRKAVIPSAALGLVAGSLGQVASIRNTAKNDLINEQIIARGGVPRKYTHQRNEINESIPANLGLLATAGGLALQGWGMRNRVAISQAGGKFKNKVRHAGSDVGNFFRRTKRSKPYNPNSDTGRIIDINAPLQLKRHNFSARDELDLILFADPRPRNSLGMFSGGNADGMPNPNAMKIVYDPRRLQAGMPQEKGLMQIGRPIRRIMRR